MISPPAFQGTAQGHRIGKGDTTTTRQTETDTRHLNRLATNQLLLYVMTGSLPLNIVGECQHKLRDATGLDPTLQTRKIELLGPHPMDRRKLTVQDMVTSFPCSRSLNRDEVRHVLNHTKLTCHAAIIRTNRAQIILSNIATSCTSPNYRFGRSQRFDQWPKRVPLFDQQMHGYALG